MCLDFTLKNEIESHAWPKSLLIVWKPITWWLCLGLPVISGAAQSPLPERRGVPLILVFPLLWLFPSFTASSWRISQLSCSMTSRSQKKLSNTFNWSSPPKPPQKRITAMFLSCLRHYFFIIAIFRTKQSMWLVIWRFRNLLFVCVKQQRVGFWVITVLQSLEKVIALLSLSFEVFFFFNCYPILLFSPAHIKWRKHFGCWRRVGFFVVFAGIFLEVLMSCYILPLFLRSCPLSLFFFLSLQYPSDCSLQTRAHGCHMRASRVIIWERYNQETAITDQKATRS